MPASTTSLTTLPPPSTPKGPTWNEQASDEVNGNNFENNNGDSLLYVRNTQVGAIVLDFFADVFGVELTILTDSVPGSATNNGVRVFGPFPAELFNDHSTTDTAQAGRVMCMQASGAGGDLLFTPFRLNRNLLS